MGKGKKTKAGPLVVPSTNPQTPSVAPMQPVDIDKVTKACVKTIAKILDVHNTGIGFNREVNEKNYTLCRLNGKNAVSIESKIPTLMLPFYKTDTRNYWIGVRLSFAPIPQGRAYYLLSTSLFLGEGQSSDEIARLIRAEWHCFADFRSKPHAQPHWHVYSSGFQAQNRFAFEDIATSSREDARVSLFDPEQALVTGAPESDEEDEVDPWEEASMFHFAMSAQWQNNVNFHYDDMNGDNVTLWIQGCLLYIRSQLDYIDRKSRQHHF